MTPLSANAARHKPWLITALVLAYAALVLATDTLAAHGVTFILDSGTFRCSTSRVIEPGVYCLFDWAVLRDPTEWHIFNFHPFDRRFLRWSMANGADLFKFIAWFVIPFVICLPRMEWAYLGVKRWRRLDYAFLVGLAVVAILAVLTILLFPSLRATYPSAASMSAAAKWNFFAHNVIWTLSWLVGWEFLHRYFLLRPLAAQWPRFGWLLIPVYEGVYHLQKPLLEAAGMVAFSLVLTYWALNRRNALLPFLAHLMVELALIIFLVVV